MSAVDDTSPAQIKALIAREIADFDATAEDKARQLEEFRDALLDPTPVSVNFSGGLSQECWAVTRSNGAYRVIYMPLARYFSLCVESELGPVDIGVYGAAIDCFASV